MTSAQDPAPGMDFWAALGVENETSDQPKTKTPPDTHTTSNGGASAAQATTSETEKSRAKRPTAGKQPDPPRQMPSGKRTAPRIPATGTPQASPPEAQREWASMFSNQPAPPKGETTSASPKQTAAPRPAADHAAPPKEAAPSKQVNGTAREKAPANGPTPETASSTSSKAPAESRTPMPRPVETQRSDRSQPFHSRPSKASQPATESHQKESPAEAPEPQQPRVEAPQRQPSRTTDQASAAAPATYVLHPPSSAWPGMSPEQTASPERLQVLAKVWSLFGEFWRDDRLNEVHIRGTVITVCGTLGVYDATGFPDLNAARWAIAAIKAAQEDIGAVVTEIGGSVVVRRRYAAGPNTAALVAASVITEEQLSQVKWALGQMKSVTVIGPAAPVVVRSFTSLIPPGSRVFQGPYAVLPAGCVVASSPLDADYVVGVRPGAVAESMAATGQVGALIANPETQFRATVRLIVTGRSAAPKGVTAR